MSHISTISTDGLEFDLDVIQALCQRQGWEFLRQTTFHWFGKDGGECEYAIHLPGVQYELGMVQGETAWKVLGDFWEYGGLGQILGEHGEVFKQMYLQESDIAWAEEKNYQWEEVPAEEGERKLVVFVNDEFGGGDW